MQQPALPARIHVLGAAGSGTTTLGAAIAATDGRRHVDVDDIYWVPTDPPFLRKRTYAARLTLLEEALAGAARWIVSGSMMDWGEKVAARADLIVFLNTPTAVRLGRLRRREHARYGPRIEPGGDMHAKHLAFLEWAAGYDGGIDAGTNAPRSLARHQGWLAAQRARILALDGTRPPQVLLAALQGTV